jgi:hypothetical protein
MGITTAAGSKFYVGDEAGSPDTQTEFEAVTWIEVGMIESLGDFGDETAIVTFTTLGDSRVRKLTAAADAGNMAVVAGRDPLDAGQIFLNAADPKLNYPFKIEAADRADENDDNSIFYFIGKITSTRNNYGANDNVVRKNYNIAIDSPIIEVPTVSV